MAWLLASKSLQILPSVDLNNVMERVRNGFRRLLHTFLMLVVVLGILAVGESLPPLRDFEALLQEHESLRQVLLGATIAMSVVGAILLALSPLIPTPKLPKGMSIEEAEASSPPMKYGQPTGYTSGRSGGSFGGEASFANTKEAWHRRSWRQDRRWRIFFSMMLGAILTLFGVFGIFIVIGPPGVKFLMGGLLVYAVGRTAWAVWRA